MPTVISRSSTAAINPLQDGWASAQKTRLDWERDAFSRMLDASESHEAGTDKSATTPVIKDIESEAIRRIESEPDHVVGVAVMEGGHSRSAMNVGSSRGDAALGWTGSAGEAGLAIPPMQILVQVESEAPYEAESLRNDLTSQGGSTEPKEAKSWSAVLDGKAHVAMRIDDEASVKMRLTTLLEELGISAATVKINGVSWETQKREGQSYGG